MKCMIELFTLIFCYIIELLKKKLLKEKKWPKSAVKKKSAQFYLHFQFSATYKSTLIFQKIILSWIAAFDRTFYCRLWLLYSLDREKKNIWNPYIISFEKSLSDIFSLSSSNGTTPHILKGLLTCTKMLNIYFFTLLCTESIWTEHILFPTSLHHTFLFLKCSYFFLLNQQFLLEERTRFF